MADDSHDTMNLVFHDVSVQEAGGRTDVLGKVLEYVQRLSEAGTTMTAELAKLGSEFIVLRGQCRVEHWQPDAIVIGPPGIFLISVTWGDAEKMLWYHAEACRRQVFESMGPDFLGAVEIVFFTNGSGETRVERSLGGPAVGSRGFDVLLMQGELARLLKAHEPPGGLRRLSAKWMAQLRADSAPDFSRSGPHPLAQRVRLPTPPD